MLFRKNPIFRLINFQRLAVRFGAVSACCLIAAAVSAQGSDASIPEGSGLEVVVGSLSSRSSGVVLADVSAVKLSLKSAVSLETTDDSAIRQLSDELNRLWIKRGRTIVLQNRFSEPEEQPASELEELRLVTADLHRLTSPAKPRLGDRESIQAMTNFAATLSPEMVDALRTRGLPLRALPRPLQALWSDIQQHRAYGESVRELRQLAQCMAQWPTVSAFDLSLPGAPPEARRRQFYLKVKDPEEPTGRGVCMHVFVDQARQDRRPNPRWVDFKPLKNSHKSLEPQWQIPLQKVALGTLANNLALEGGPRLSVPRYARERLVWVASNNGSRSEVISAIGDLYGWELTVEKGGYRLDRPKLSAARNYVDLNEKLNRALTPQIRHLLDAQKAGHTLAYGRQMELVRLAADAAAGPEWTEFKPSQLDPLSQRRLATWTVVRQLSSWSKKSDKSAGPPAWISQPEKGILRIRSGMGPKPLLFFECPAGSGKGWGWVIGSESKPGQ